MLSILVRADVEIVPEDDDSLRTRLLRWTECHREIMRRNGRVPPLAALTVLKSLYRYAANVAMD